MMTTLLSGATAPVTGHGVSEPFQRPTYQATLSGTGTLAAAVDIEGSNDGTGFMRIGSLSLAGSTLVTEGFVYHARWKYVRAKLVSISGTGATITVTMDG